MAERAIRAIYPSLTAPWYGTVQQCTPKHKHKVQPVPASQTMPDHSRNDDIFFKRTNKTRPGLAAGE
jgi:hypothetical protein